MFTTNDMLPNPMAKQTQELSKYWTAIGITSLFATNYYSTDLFEMNKQTYLLLV